MSNESFAMVFAPTFDEVEAQCAKHRRSEKAWLIIALCFAASLIFCLRLFLGDAGNTGCDILIARVVFGGALFELAGTVASVIAMIYHGAKAEQYEQKLDTEYISFSRR